MLFNTFIACSSQKRPYPPAPHAYIEGYPTKFFPEIQESIMQTNAKPTLGLSGSSPNIIIYQQIKDAGLGRLNELSG